MPILVIDAGNGGFSRELGLCLKDA